MGTQSYATSLMCPHLSGTLSQSLLHVIQPLQLCASRAVLRRTIAKLQQVIPLESLKEVDQAAAAASQSLGHRE